MMRQVSAAVIGTVGFSVLYGMPRQYYPHCGITGGVGWLVYSLLIPWCSTPEVMLFASVVVAPPSRLFAVQERCPVTISLISGIFPLVLGAEVYWTAYYIVANDVMRAAQTGFTALEVAVVIVLGIVFVFQLPQWVSRLGFLKKREDDGEKWY